MVRICAKCEGLILFVFKFIMEVKNENQYKFSEAVEGFSLTFESFPRLRKRIRRLWAIERCIRASMFIQAIRNKQKTEERNIQVHNRFPDFQGV